MQRCCEGSAGRPDVGSVLREERIIGYLDPGAEEILARLNSRPSLWTTSSCTGRITIVEGSFHWERDDARIVYKTHDPLSLEELLRVLGRPFSDLWLKVTGPIIHFQTPSSDCAFTLLEAARRAGFKHSGVISSGEVYTVEVVAPTRIDAPLRIEWRDVYSLDGLPSLVAKANAALEEGRRRLNRLAVNVENLETC